jgi:hypothetical protein
MQAQSLPQTITFDAIPNQIFGISPFQIAAEASSGLPVSFTSATPGICTTKSTLVTLLGAGTCSITASQSGNASYSAAPAVTRNFTVSVAKISGTLAQTAASPYATGAYPRSIAVGDFNRDGFADIAIANWADGTVLVLLGDGSGGFRAAPGSPISVGGYPQSIAVGDFNGDGIQDLAIAGANKPVLLGDGTGGFSPAPNGPSAALVAGQPIVVGDFNGDGIQDLAIGGQAMGVAVLLGNGSGGFTPTTGNMFETPGAAALAVGDFNGDGNQDIAVASWVQGYATWVYILFGNGTGGFREQMAFSAGTTVSHPAAIAVGDFNGDGVADLALGASNGMTVLLGDGSGGFSATSGSPYLPVTPSSLVVADVNGDGIPDLIAGGPEMMVLIGDGTGAFTPKAIPFSGGAYPIAAGVADFNGDGITDLAEIDWKANTVSVLLGGKASSTSVLTTTAPSCVPAGQPVPLTLAVSDAGLGFSAPTGGATFFDGTTSLGAANQNASPYTFTATQLSLGLHTFTASYAGDARTAASVSNSLTVQVGEAQTITFGAIGNVTVNVGSITLTATASSGLAVTYTVSVVSYGYCSVLGNVVTIGANGTCTITASQAGNAVYAPAPPVTQSFQIDSAQTITFGALSDVKLGVVLTVSATASSYLPVTLTSNTLPVCTVSGSAVTTIAVGTCSITASQAGNTLYAPAPPVTQSFKVEAGQPQTVAFSPPGNVTLGVAPFTLSATASSGLAVTFTSNTLAICTVSGSTVTAVAAGVCSITASQAGNDTYAAATPVTQTFRIVGAETITFDPIPNQILGASPFQIAAQAAGGVPVSLASTAPQVCVAASTSVRLLTAGTCSIKAAQIGDAAIAASTALTRSFTVSAAKPSGALNEEFAISLDTVSAPQALAVGDFNGDGSPDIAVADLGDNTVTVLLGNGSGGFTQAPGSPFAAGNQPHDIAVGDFNGDGIQDLAVASENASDITILLGNGSGGFIAAPGVPLPTGIYGAAIRVGDFNNDGIQDLVVAGTGYTNVIVLLGNGAGGFSPAPSSPIPIGTQPDSFAVADLNADGNQDIVVVDYWSNSLTVLLGDGSGGFKQASGSPFAVGAGPTSVAVGDFNHDGIPDLAATNSSDSTVTVLLGDGSGNFSPAAGSPVALATVPNALAVGDFNGDGISDLAIAGIQSASHAGFLTVLLGNGSGGFSFVAGAPFTGGRDPESLVVGDFNGDGIPDVATANISTGSMAIFLGGQAPTAAFLSTTAPSTISYGQPAPLTLSVSDTGFAFGAPTGSATFFAGSTALGSAAQNASPYTYSVDLLPPGNYTLSATYNGDARSAASASNAISIQIAQASQTITFGALADVNMGITPFAISATASSGYAVGFASSTLAVCAVSGNTVTILTPGSCSITASQAGDADYAPANPVTRSFNVIADSYITGQVVLAGGGLSGIAVTLGGSKSASTTTDANGDYSFTGLTTGGSYAVTPSNSGYVFSPLNAAVNNLSGSQAAGFTATAIVGSVSANSTTVGPSAASNLSAAPSTLTAPISFCIPITLALIPLATADTLSFGVQVTPVGAAPPLTAPLTFTKGTAVSGVPSVMSASSAAIDVAWTSLAEPSSTLTLGMVGGTIPAGAVAGQSYTASVTVASAANETVPVIVNAGAEAAVGVTLSHLEGDVSPYTSDTSPNFGDGKLDIQDLIQELFAVNHIPGFIPAAGSDRFDAMDVAPADTPGARGGDGVLDIRDLIVELFRVNNLDMSRPLRSCLPPAPGGSGGNSEAPAEPGPRDAQAPESRGEAEAALSFGTPEPSGIPVYLDAKAPLVHVALTFGAGDQQSQFRFTPAPAAPPALTYSQTGAVAVAFPGGITLPAGSRLLLGYIVPPSGASPNLEIYGMSAAGLDDNREVRLSQ